MPIIKIENNDISEIKSSQKIALLDFYADWCGPCRMLSPTIDEIADERNDIVVAKINVDKNPELSNEYAIFSVPTLVVLRDGKVINKATGVRPKDAILELIDK